MVESGGGEMWWRGEGTGEMWWRGEGTGEMWWRGEGTGEMWWRGEGQVRCGGEEGAGGTVMMVTAHQLRRWAFVVHGVAY